MAWYRYSLCHCRPAYVVYKQPPSSVSPTHIGQPQPRHRVQVNYLGPFYLTRLLEDKLWKCRARVVNVSSVMHRMCCISSVHEFLTSSKAGNESNFAYSWSVMPTALQEPGWLVDPGGVATGIYRGAPVVAGIVEAACRVGIMATPAEGCKAVVFAATCSWPAAPGCVPWSPESRQRVAATALQAPFFARGLFASPVITGRGSNSIVARMVRALFGPLVALLDQPVRWLLRGSCGTGQTFVVPENAQARDRGVLNSLWESSSQMCGLAPDLMSEK